MTTFHHVIQAGVWQCTDSQISLLSAYAQAHQFDPLAINPEMAIEHAMSTLAVMHVEPTTSNDRGPIDDNAATHLRAMLRHAWWDAKTLPSSGPWRRFSAFTWSHRVGWQQSGSFDTYADAAAVVLESAGEVFDHFDCRPKLRVAPSETMLKQATIYGHPAPEWAGAWVGCSGLGESILPADWDGKKTTVV